MIQDHENACVPDPGIATPEEGPDLENVADRDLATAVSVSGRDQETATNEYAHDPCPLPEEELATEETTDRLPVEGSDFCYVLSINLEIENNACHTFSVFFQRI